MGKKGDAPVVGGYILRSYKRADQSLLASDGASAQPQQAILLCLYSNVARQSISYSIVGPWPGLAVYNSAI